MLLGNIVAWARRDFGFSKFCAKKRKLKLINVNTHFQQINQSSIVNEHIKKDDKWAFVQYLIE